MKELKFKKRKKHEKNFALRLSLYILAVMLFAAVIVGTLVLIIHYSGVTFGGHLDLVLGIGGIISIMLIVALITGILNRYIMEPLESVIDAVKRIKDGDYSVHIEKKRSVITAYTRLDSLADCFNEMAEELRGADTFSRDFMSNFSHEFKTPLASIRGFAAQLYESESESVQKKEFAKIILAESAYLDNLCSNTLLFTKLESQNFSDKRELYMLDEQLRSVLISLEPQWSDKCIDMSLEADETPVYQCEELLSHVWRNLCDNAIKYTPEGGNIRVCCTQDEDSVTVSVCDTGIGIDEKDLPYIFDRHYRSERTEKYGGNGLGLALSRRIAEVCGGEINVGANAEKGSVFTVKLPKNR